MPDHLIGRDEQMARVTAVLEAGDGHLLVEGESGSGKTAFLRATGRVAGEHGYRMTRAQAHSTEQSFPFGVVWQLFDPLLAPLDEQDRHDLMSGAVAAAARLLRPGQVGAEHGAAPGAGDPALHHALRELARRLAEPQPLLLAVDDVHWADPESLDWLTFLVREPATAPLVVVVTYTPGTGHPVPDGLLSTPATVSLPELGEDDIAALAGEVLGEAPDASFVQACRQATNGNAFLVTEYLRAAAAEREPPELVPRRVTRWVSSRMAQLTPDAIKLAQAIVVLGDGAGLPAVAALADLDPAKTGALVESLTQMGFLTADGPGFAHRVVRTAIDQTIDPGARRAAHARAAAILHEAGRPPGEVAGHLLAAGPIGRRWAAETLRAAAEAVRGPKAVTRAVDYLRRALREPVDSELRAELLAELGHVELHSAAEPDPRPRLGAAVDHLSAAYEGARDAPLLARVAEDLAIAHYLDCAPGQAIRVLDRTAAGPAAGHEDLVDRLAALALAMAGPNAAPAHIERLDRLRAAATHDPDLAIMIAAFNGGRAALAGRPDEAVIQARRVAAAGRPRTPRRLLDHATAAGVLCCADVLGPAARCATAMIAQGDGAGPAGFAVLGHMLAARVAYLEGRLDDAIDEARIAGGLQFAVNGRAHAGARAWELAALLVKGDLNASAAILTGAGLLGERGTAPPWARDSASAAGGTGGTGDAGDVGGGGRDGDGGAVEAFIDAHFLGARGLLNELRGDHEAALADHIECGRRLTDAGIVNPAFVPWRSRAARVSHRLGRGEAALRLAGEELALARRWGTPRAVGVALRALGVAAGGADGLSLLEESVALLARSPARVEHAFALYDLGRALGESGRRAEARPLLHESYRLAAGCGARPLAERCAAEIKRVGGRRPRALIAGPAALTAQERRIAERAVAGATNREIAEELFLTLRTVEAHLTGVYRKLGITGRAQLAARLTG